MRSKPTTYDEFRQKVRRYQRSQLLEVIARAAVTLEQRAEFAWKADRHILPVTHSTLAAIAGEAVVSGNEHRSRHANFRDLIHLSDTYMNVAEQLRVNEPGLLQRFVVQTAAEQFRWQLSEAEEMGRTYALYVYAAQEAQAAVVTEEMWRDVLGSSLTDYVGAVFLMFVGAMQHQGRFDFGWLDQPNFEEIGEFIELDTIRHVARRHLVAQPDEHRAIAEQHRPEDPSLQRLAFNPLEKYPFVELPDGTVLAPQPRYVLRKASATSLYYPAVERHGTAFTDELGDIFEHYVGMQLQHVPDVDLFEQVEFGNNNRSVDWFVATSRTLILVEVKATRMTWDAHAGGEKFVEDVQRTIGTAFVQIDRTVGLLEDDHPSFAHLPRPGRIAALVVTLEPYYVGHLPEDFGLVQQPRVPVAVAPAREVEHLVGVAQHQTVAAVLDDLLDPDRDAEHRSLARALEGMPSTLSPLLEAGWDAYPWKGTANREA